MKQKTINITPFSFEFTKIQDGTFELIVTDNNKRIKIHCQRWHIGWMAQENGTREWHKRYAFALV